MKYFWLLVVLFGSFNSLASQEVHHAPAVEQCRADQRLWMNEVEQTNVSTSFLDLWA
jgi:hypothetical protein